MSRLAELGIAIDPLFDTAIGQLIRKANGLGAFGPPSSSTHGVEEFQTSSLIKLQYVTCASKGMPLQDPQWWVVDENLSYYSLFSATASNIAAVRILLLGEVSDYLARTEELLEILGLTFADSDREFFVQRLAYLALQGKLAASFKMAVNLAMTRHFHLEAPLAKKGIPGLSVLPDVLTRALGRWRSERGRRSLVTGQKVNTIFQGFKKGLLPVRPDAITKQLNGHADSLRRDPALPDRPSGPFSFTVQEHLDKIVQKMTRLFRLDTLCTHDPQVRRLSARASVESNFASGGSVGFGFTRLVNQRVGGSSPDWARRFHFAASCDEFLGFSERLGKVGIKEVRGYWITDHMLADEDFDYRTEPSIAVPACILEPMKVRVITKPRACQYAPLADFQKKLWSVLARHRSETFLYTSEPVDHDNLLRFVLTCRWQPGQKWVSGDYTGATDNLKGAVTLAFARAIFASQADTNPELYERIFRSLAGGDIRYIYDDDGVTKGVSCPREDVHRLACEDPKDFDSRWRKQIKEGSIQQKNGQLMGNVLSFPLLCMANLACFWMAHERFVGRELQFRHLPPVRVNGDDILFKSPSDAYYANWAQCASDFGFELSIGKNFSSDDVLQINSALYRTVTRRVPMEWHDEYYVDDIAHIPYVNFGLITNRKKNDCSLDYSLQKVGLTGVDEQLPSWVYRVCSAPATVSTLVAGLDSKLRRRSITVYERHMQNFVKQFPRLPWNCLSREDVVTNPSVLLDLSRSFSCVIPTDPMGLKRQILSELSVMKIMTNSWTDVDCIGAYRKASRHLSLVSSRINMEEQEWKRISLGTGRWVDHSKRVVPADREGIISMFSESAEPEPLTV